MLRCCMGSCLGLGGCAFVRDLISSQMSSTQTQCVSAVCHSVIGSILAFVWSREKRKDDTEKKSEGRGRPAPS